MTGLGTVAEDTISRRTRPRGFVPYRPQAAAADLIDQVQEVLRRYVDQLPLTIRQVFYVLVSLYAAPKTESFYDRLCDILNRARRGHLVPMNAFRDDGFIEHEPTTCTGVDDALAWFRQIAETYRVDRQAGQAVRLAVWCEAAGMVPQLVRVAHEYGVPVYSSGGFDGTTPKHDMGEKWARLAPIEVLHIGDHDPSGVHMFSSLHEDVRAFAEHYDVDAEVRFTRLAVTPAQIAEYGLPTAPPKPTDRRRFDGALTTQAEALDPATLASILRTAITERMNPTTYQTALTVEARHRADLISRMQRGGLWVD